MKVTNTDRPTQVTFSTRDKKTAAKQQFAWWKAPNKRELANQITSTAAYLKETQNYRFRQAAVYARLYGNLSLFNFLGSNMMKMDQQTALPADRPTFNIIQSATDTLVARISQSRPSPVFLTDNSDYKERTLAKKLNNFIQGEFFRTKAYDKATLALRDALVEGTGVLHVYETQDHTVGLERVLFTELLTDPNESIYGEPRQLYRIKLIDREVLKEMMTDEKGSSTIIEAADNAYPDNSAEASKTVSDLVLVVEAWHLPSGPNAKDGRHTIACSSGVLCDEEYNKETFPFIFLHYSPRLLGFWAQGLAEQLMGTQMEINQLLFTISKSIRLVGVPRVFVEDGSKVVKAHLDNQVGSIVTYRGTKPSYEVAPCVPAELYAQLQRLIQYGYQQCGVSALQAQSEKPAGLNSGEAIRSYEDVATDRYATLSRRYDNLFIELAYTITDLAKDIAGREGKYTTIYPNKNGTRQIVLPEIEKELKNPYVIQCFNMSSLPRDPAGRMAKVAEMIQGGMITIKEGRRLLDFPDLDQMERLANASEERIFQYLDEIIEDGKYTPPDSFMDLALAEELVVQYYNLYVSANLEEEKQQQLRDFFTQIQAFKQQAATPPPGAAPQQPVPQAQAAPLPVSPLVPNVVTGAPSA